MVDCKVRPCSCVHEYQDKLYGPGMRLFTVKKNGNLVCTVCSKTASGK